MKTNKQTNKKKKRGLQETQSAFSVTLHHFHCVTICLDFTVVIFPQRTLVLKRIKNYVFSYILWVFLRLQNK